MSVTSAASNNKTEMLPPASQPRSVHESRNEPPAAASETRTRTANHGMGSSKPSAKRTKMDSLDTASTSDGSIGSGQQGDPSQLSKKTCADGEYEGDLNPCGEREGRGIMQYLGDPTTKG